MLSTVSQIKLETLPNHRAIAPSTDLRRSRNEAPSIAVSLNTWSSPCVHSFQHRDEWTTARFCQAITVGEINSDGGHCTGSEDSFPGNIQHHVYQSKWLCPKSMNARGTSLADDFAIFCSFSKGVTFWFQMSTLEGRKIDAKSSRFLPRQLLVTVADLV